MTQLRTICFLLLMALLASEGALAKHARAGLIETTVANLPTSGPAGMSRIVLDGVDGGDCVVGSGRFAVLCTFNGAATWTAGGGAGTGTGANVNDFLFASKATADLPNVVNLGALATGYIKCTVSAGVCTASSDANVVTAAGTLTSNLPMIGSGTKATAVGTRSGNTTQFVTTTGTQTSGDCVKIDASGNHIANGSACGGGTGSVTSVATTGPISGGTITTTGTLSCPTCTTNASALTANLPVIGAGSQATAVGTRSGNTTAFVTTTGSQTSGDCVKIDASGNHIANGSACGSGGTGTVTSVATTSPITGGTITGTGTLACATCVTSAAALTSNLPVIGSGSQGTAVGTRSGNTTAYVTTTGSQTSGDCVKIDASGNHIANGSACGSASIAVAGAISGSTHNKLLYSDNTGLLQELTLGEGQVATSISGSIVAGTIDAAPSTATFLMQTANSGTSAEQALSSLASGCLSVTTGTGVVASSGSACGAGGSGATTALDNLASVAINTSLLPGTAGVPDLGSATKPFEFLYLSGTSGTPGTNNFKMTGSATGARTITLPDNNISLAGFNVANPWSAKQTFAPDGTAAGVNVGSVAGDPSTPVNGDMWYDSTGNKFRCRENGASANCIGAGSSSDSFTMAAFALGGGVSIANATVYVVADNEGTYDETNSGSADQRYSHIVPVASHLTKAYWGFRCATPAVGVNTTALVIRKNDTTDSAGATIRLDATQNKASETMNIAYAAGDVWDAKFTSPTWSTSAPTGCRIHVTTYWSVP